MGFRWEKLSPEEFQQLQNLASCKSFFYFNDDSSLSLEKVVNFKCTLSARSFRLLYCYTALFSTFSQIQIHSWPALAEKVSCIVQKLVQISRTPAKILSSPHFSKIKRSQLNETYYIQLVKQSLIKIDK